VPLRRRRRDHHHGQADGLLRIPSLTEASTPVKKSISSCSARLTNRADDSFNSHDLSIDILGDELKRNFPGSRIAASNVGSLGGLSAIRGETHMASISIDPATGHYNVPDIQRAIPSTPLVHNRLVRRMQGLLVQPVQRK
jgi:putative molybdopterin biosynthesis protein